MQKAVQLLSDLAQLNKIDEASFVAKCLPVVIHLWGMSDRAVRTSLLKSLKNLVTFIPSSAVNKNIFEPLLAGFSDSNAKYLKLMYYISFHYLILNISECARKP